MMIIIHSNGIETKLLSPASKRYLSRLLIGTIGINPDFITWKQLLKPITQLYPFVFNPFSEGETSTSLIENIKKWNRLLTADQLKPHILKSLTQHEKEHNESELKNSLYHRKKKSIASLGATLVVGMGLFTLLFLLTPIATSNIILASIFTSAMVFFTGCFFILDFYPAILLKKAQHADQCKQKTDINQEIEIATTLSETENSMTGISSRPDTKKTPSKHLGKSSAFNNCSNISTNFFHFTHKKRHQPKPNCREIKPRNITTSDLEQNLCGVLARLS
jgi:hypothetical protein